MKNRLTVALLEILPSRLLAHQGLQSMTAGVSEMGRCRISTTRQGRHAEWLLVRRVLLELNDGRLEQVDAGLQAWLPRVEVVGERLHGPPQPIGPGAEVVEELRGHLGG